MGEWRYYAMRPESGLWLDTNVQLADPEFTWALSAPLSGKCLIPAGMTPHSRDEYTVLEELVDVNPFPNPSAEVNSTGVTTALGGQVSTSSTDRAWVGNRSFKITHTGTLQPRFRLSVVGLNYPEGTTKTFKMRMWNPSTNAGRITGVNLLLRDETTATTYQTITGIMPVDGPIRDDAWMEFAVTYTVPAGRTLGRVYWDALTSATRSSADVFYMDGWQASDDPNEPYFDGDSPNRGDFNFRWEGVPHASRSLKYRATRVPTAPALLKPAVAEDGRNVWGKWDTILFAEEDGDLSWYGICSAANPDKDGLHLEFVSGKGWLEGVPYQDEYTSWRVNVFDVVRHLIAHTKKYAPRLEFVVPANDSAFTVGDPEPPRKPKEPPRRKGEKKSEWQDSKRYNEWQKDRDEWNEKYGQYEQFSIAWYEAPYVGEEIDSLAKETGFDYRDRVEWADKGNLVPRFYFDFADNMITRRDDIAFVDGINLAAPLDPKDGDEKFANYVIGLGAGEGRKMARVTVGQADGRLYQAQYVQYKSIRNTNSLRGLATADHRVLNNKDPKLDTVVVWDVPGFASVGSLKVGDEVRVTSENAIPPIDAWAVIKQITRNPTESTVTCAIEVTT